MERVNEILQSYKYPLLLGLVGAVLIFSGSISSKLVTPQAESKQLPAESLSSSHALIKVDIAGAINKPGVYDLAKETRVDDLIKEAGGFHPEANAEFVAKQLNLSQKLADGQKIYIPFQGESVAEVSTIQNGEITGNMGGVTQKININTGSQSQLEELPGIGPSTASKIIANRPYASLNDLLNKKSVGKATYDKIKDLIEI